MHIDCKMADSEVISLCQTGSSKLHLDSKKPGMNVVDVGEVTSGSRSVIEDFTSFQILIFLIVLTLSFSAIFTFF